MTTFHPIFIAELIRSKRGATLFALLDIEGAREGLMMAGDLRRPPALEAVAHRAPHKRHLDRFGLYNKLKCELAGIVASFCIYLSPILLSVDRSIAIFFNTSLFSSSMFRPN